MSLHLSRRGFLAGSASLAATLAARQSRGINEARASRHVEGPYGALHAVPDLETGLPLILLPEGFQYRSYSWSGDPMTSGGSTPDLHDGMGVIATHGQGDSLDVTLVRNHERWFATPIAAKARYDTGGRMEAAAPAGGTTTLRFRGRRWDSVVPSLGGTLYNCSGGVTPWGTWFSCEEIVLDLTDQGGRKHGYVFEVREDAAATTGRPIVAMGRFPHEAVAVDPKSNFAYLTEDATEASCSAFYRFVPHDRSGTPGSFEAGGKLQAAKVVGRRHADLRKPTVGDTYALEWVDIRKPDADPAKAPVRTEAGPKGALASGPFVQAWSRGALWINRGEGCCHHRGKILFIDTDAGVDASGRIGYGDGALWELDPATDTLRALFVSGTQEVGDNIDNITVSPRGGILLCEDGDPVTDRYGPGTRLIALTAEGDSYAFAKNNIVLGADALATAGKHVPPKDYRPEEWAGCCFDARGEVLFVNIQNPGITFAIWGPWERGNL